MTKSWGLLQLSHAFLFPSPDGGVFFSFLLLFLFALRFGGARRKAKLVVGADVSSGGVSRENGARDSRSPNAATICMSRYVDIGLDSSQQPLRSRSRPSPPPSPPPPPPPHPPTSARGRAARCGADPMCVVGAGLMCHVLHGQGAGESGRVAPEDSGDPVRVKVPKTEGRCEVQIRWCATRDVVGGRRWLRLLLHAARSSSQQPATKHAALDSLPVVAGTWDTPMWCPPPPPRRTVVTGGCGCRYFGLPLARALRFCTEVRPRREKVLSCLRFLENTAPIHTDPPPRRPATLQRQQQPPISLARPLF